MSFSSDLKDEIIGTTYKNACCRRAIMLGAIASKAEVDENQATFLTIDNKDVISFLVQLFSEFYGKDTEISAPTRGGRGKILKIRSKAAKKFVDNLSADAMHFEKCPFCKSSFIRGVFITTGRVSDPNKQFCLEFSLKNRVDLFLEYFGDLGFDFKTSSRGNENLIYTKNSGTIEDFFGICELNSATFAIMNVKIANGLKNDANRLRNFDTVNISKAVDAAGAQYALIKKLDEKKLLNSLPEELIQTAKMRLTNPDMSLNQLALHSIPPISKSGLSHRMSKIMKLGEELLKKY